MSTYYKTNNKRFNVYVADRRVEAKNAADQQDRLDELLAEQRGEIDTSLRFARMAKRVINQFGEEVQKPSMKMAETGMPAATDYLREIIKTGQLSQWFNKVKKMDTSGLSKTAKIIVNDIKNPSTRKQIVSSVNSEISDLEEKGQLSEEKITQSVIDNLAGGNQKVIEEISKKLDLKIQTNLPSPTPSNAPTEISTLFGSTDAGRSPRKFSRLEYQNYANGDTIDEVLKELNIDPASIVAKKGNAGLFNAKSSAAWQKLKDLGRTI